MSVGTITTPSRGLIELSDGPCWLYASCGTAIVAFYCVTHAVETPTHEHMVAHCKMDGDHVVVRRCPLHGYESAAKGPKQPEREPGEEAA